MSYDQLLEKLRQDLPGVVFKLEAMQWLHLALWVVVGIFVVAMLCRMVFTVETQHFAIVERFGKFRHVAGPGLNFKHPLFDHVRVQWSVEVLQNEFEIDSITKDKVSVKLTLNVMHQIKQGSEQQAFYLLNKPYVQLENYVYDVIRAVVPTMTLDELFASKTAVSEAVQKEIAADMLAYGFEIVEVLLLEIVPDDAVVKAMNGINAAERDRQAAEQRAEAAKITAIKAAEAQAEADRLRGHGMAMQRLEITKGLEQSVKELQAAVQGATGESILSLLAALQYMETLEKVALSGKSNTIMVPSSPGASSDLLQQLSKAMLLTKG